MILFLYMKDLPKCCVVKSTRRRWWWLLSLSLVWKEEGEGVGLAGGLGRAGPEVAHGLFGQASPLFFFFCAVFFSVLIFFLLFNLYLLIKEQNSLILLISTIKRRGSNGQDCSNVELQSSKKNTHNCHP